MHSIAIAIPQLIIKFNPNLCEIIHALSEFYKVYLITEEIFKKYQISFSKNVHYIYMENMSFSKNSYGKFSLVIGVNEGIIFANCIAKKQNIPLVLLNYEIIFKHECDALLKKEEISACQNVIFAIAQDSMRAYLLSKENKIPIEKIMYIPVASSGNNDYKRNNYLRKKLNIPKDKKIAIYIGGLAGRWTMKDSIMKIADSWPKDWVLVLHATFELKDESSDKIYISKEPVENANMLENMLLSADCGIVLYDMDIFLETYWGGKNLLFMGQSSGKTATYLKYGLPILTNNTVTSSNFISDYNLGFRFNSLEELNPRCFDNVNMALMKKRCRNFFKTYLDFSIYKENFLNLVNAAILNKHVEKIISKNNAILPETKNYHSMQLLNVYDSVYEQFKTKIDNVYEHFNTKLMHNKKIIKFALSYKNILIYGAGYYAKIIATDLKEFGVQIDGFVVSDGEKKQKKLCGKPIHYFSENPFTASDTGIIISISNKDISQKIAKMLKNKGFSLFK